ncbi:M4 family metallopeptidase [Streptomyces sp. NPDC057702]|uniref:M4 family metallopeptidase n=1 Tax=unclassified Streptomyces TaxID=2593676 RepID=UPI0036874293
MTARHPRRGSDRRSVGRRAGRRARAGGIPGAAALLSVAALVVPALPASAVAAPAPPPPAEVVAGQHTRTPALVRGIREAAPAASTPAEAARAHLDGARDRYRIAHPRRDLVPLDTSTTGDQEVVRFQQRHRGVPVLGGQYLVRMAQRAGERVVTGTSGRYFTEVRADTTPQVSEELAVERAVDAVAADLAERRFASRAPVADEADPPPLTGTVRGLVVLPNGAGVLTRQVTVRGTDPANGGPVLREVYVDARAGYPVLQYSGIRTFDAPRATGRPAPQPAPRRARATERGFGVKLDGQGVALEVEYEAYREVYALRDRTRIPENYGSLATWDARGKTPTEVSGQWPPELAVYGAPTPAFPFEATNAGAVDAHWAAARVYDYFHDKHGRNSLDGHGMTIDSLVGVADYSGGYVNAFWDGDKMVYGIGDQEFRPLSAALDVVGHEMTHGVIQHTANLVYAGQSGALNEAIADYFGNAVEADAYDIPVSDPDSGLLGERLCRTKGPRECALRDLNDGRTTTGSYLGVGFGTDNGGVHLNSTIFGGALWDVREELGAALTDRIVYRALTQYLTPLDGFTEGRTAILAAAVDLGVPAADQRALQRAFTAHGIVPGWESALGIDSDVLLDRVNTYDTNLGGGGGWWVASRSNEDGSEPYSVWAGRGDGTGSPKPLSPNDGRYHVNPVTDGTTVVWQAYGTGGGAEVLARPIAGGPVKKLWRGRGASSAMDVDGDTVTFGYSNHGGRQGVAYLSLRDPLAKVTVGGGTSHQAYTPSLSHGKIAYQDKRRVRAAEYEWTTHLRDVATGEDTIIQRAAPGTRLGPTDINGTHVFWLLDDDRLTGATALRRARLDGSDIVDLSPQTGPHALNAYALTVSADSVTVGSYVPDAEIRNDTVPKLHQFAAAGAPDDPRTYRGRVSCNRGEQAPAVALTGSQVVWQDATTGISGIVTRTRPTGRCA